MSESSAHVLLMDSYFDFMYAKSVNNCLPTEKKTAMGVKLITPRNFNTLVSCMIKRNLSTYTSMSF